MTAKLFIFTETPLKMKPIQDLFDFNTTDLYELHDRLWYEYFTPAKPLDKATAKFIRDQLNVVGEQINKEADERKTPMARVIEVTPSTTYAADTLGPNWQKVIYVETAAPLEPVASHMNRRIKKMDHPSTIRPSRVVEEDLLGDVPKKTSKVQQAAPKKGSPAKAIHYAKEGEKPKSVKVGKPKGNYDIVAECAAKGMDKDAIEKATGLPRKTITDNLWRYNKLNNKK